MNQRARNTRQEPRLGITRPRSPAEILEPARAPTRPQSSREEREPGAISFMARMLSGLLTVALLLMAGFGGLSLFLYHHFERAGPLEVSRTVAIPRGEGRIQIAERLESEGVISSRWIFIISHLMHNWLGSDKPMELKAGEYEFKKQASMRAVLETLAEGKSVLYKVTIPEGLTSRQIIERLRAEESLTGELLEVPPEGTLLPDTYRFSRGMSRQELVDRMRVEQQRIVAAAWAKRKPDLPIASPEHAVILASIIEKETARADERDRVAAVFVNRLRKGMRLQSDPTIIYGIAPGQGPLGRPILRSDIDQKTAYNTYQIDGLPPTPICNPGRLAIEATLNPAVTGDIYFVADGTGGHKFSETLKDHNAAVAVWRKVERDQRARSQADEPADEPKTVKPPLDAVPAPSVETIAVVPSALPAVAPNEVPPTPQSGESRAATAASIPLPLRKPKKL